MKAYLLKIKTLLIEWLLRPFVPLMKKIKKYRRLFKGIKIVKKILEIFLSIVNIGLTLWEIYDGFIKDKLEAMNNKNKEVIE